MSLKLLIADDEYFIRQRIKRSYPGKTKSYFFAGEAENGQQVIDHLEKEPVDLLLLDIKMPQMNGIETARYIKEHFPSVHMLILSGYNDFRICAHRDPVRGKRISAEAGCRRRAGAGAV